MAEDAAEGDAGAVIEANAAFYRAFEAGDLDAIAAAWSHSNDVVCAHPGRRALRGWFEIYASWKLIVDAGNAPQMILTDTEVTVRGSVGWVSVTENMLTGGRTATASALNVFEQVDGHWLMIAHHAGPVMG